MKAKRIFVAVLFAACAALAALALAAFANNVSVVVRWWAAFSAAGGDSAAMTVKVHGIIPQLDWSAVDHSAVTTLIPLIGFTCLAVSSLRMLGRRRIGGDDFPFFPGSDQLHIALGLFGTLWGIIVIGYFRLDTVTMSDLMQCLHTALFSTLTAVVWVFLIDRPIVRPLFRRILARMDLADASEGDLASAVDDLTARLAKASDAFEKREREYEAHFERRLAEYEREFERRRKEYEEFFTRRISELEKHAKTADGRLAAVAEALGR